MSVFDTLRDEEYGRLDAAGHVYLDYTGSGLYGESQIQKHMDLLRSEVLGNPHSQNPTSLLATELVEEARAKILEFFDADPAEYAVIFTMNASGALKLVGESYPFEQGSRYVLLSDNHNSVNGIREFARAAGADITYLKLDSELRAIDVEAQLQELDASKVNLFSFPAQSNFSGVKHPLAWVKMARDLGYDVILDAAAYVPTSRLSLREVQPDFVSVSFYKMFGYPTGVGALIARLETLSKLQRPWFAGGTVRFVSTQNKVHRLYTSGEAFEDGTINFMNIPAIKIGLDYLEQVGMDNINYHVADLTAMTLSALLDLRHSNGQPMIDFYGPPTNDMRGGTLTFNVMTPEGTEIDSKIVERKANEQMISLRTGCFCNPGAAETAFHYSAIDAYQCFDEITAEEFFLQQFSACMNDMPVGAVRVSLGIASNESDVRRLIDFMHEFIDFRAPVVEKPGQLPDVIGG